MNLAAMRTEFYDAIGQDTDVAADQWGQERVHRLLNRAAEHVAGIIRRNSNSELTKTGTISVVSGTREYNLPTDFLELSFAERTPSGSTRPREIPVDSFMKRGRQQVEANALYLRGSQIGYYVTPTDSYTLTLHYSPAITTMTAGTHDLSSTAFQNPPIRSEFHGAIVARAAYKALLAEGSSDLDRITADWANERAEMIRTLRRRVKKARYINVTDRYAPMRVDRR